MAYLDLQQGLLLDDAGWLWRMTDTGGGLSGIVLSERHGLGDLGINWEPIIQLTRAGGVAASNIIRATRGLPAGPYDYGVPAYTSERTLPTRKDQIDLTAPGVRTEIDLNKILKWGAIGLGGVFLFKMVTKK